MPQSDVDLAQQALFKLGAETIAALNEQNIRAKTMSARIDPVKRALLRLHPWNFARKRVILKPLTIANITNASGLIRVTVTGHPFSTADYVRIIEVKGTIEANGLWTITKIDANNFDLIGSVFTNAYVSGGRTQRAPPFGYDWSHAVPSDFIRLISSNDLDLDPDWRLEGGRILTDDLEIELEYIYNVTDYLVMDVLFYEVLSTYLAWDTCIRLTQSRELKNQLWQDFENVLPKSRFVDATEDSIRKIRATDWLISRQSAPYGFVRDPLT